MGDTEEEDFRFFCIIWSHKGYRGTYAEREDKPSEDMDPHCTKALKIACLDYGVAPSLEGGCINAISSNGNNPDEAERLWDECRAACKVAAPGG